MNNVIPLFTKKLLQGREHLNRAFTDFSDDAQISLPFSAPHALYLVAGEISNNNEDFYCFASQKGLAAFFDMRFSPRLDFIAATRQKAFESFKQMGLKYYDVLGRLGVDSLSSALDHRLEILKDVVTVIEGNVTHNEPCLMVFDDHVLAIEYARAMHQCFDLQIIDSKYIADCASNIKLQM